MKAFGIGDYMIEGHASISGPMALGGNLFSGYNIVSAGEEGLEVLQLEHVK